MPAQLYGAEELPALPSYAALVVGPRIDRINRKSSAGSVGIHVTIVPNYGIVEGSIVLYRERIMSNKQYLELLPPLADGMPLQGAA